MVFLAITPKGLEDAMRTSAQTAEAVWCGADALSEADFTAKAFKGLTRFSYGLTGENTVLIQDAVATIAEHHPGQLIWVEVLPEQGPTLPLTRTSYRRAL